MIARAESVVGMKRAITMAGTAESTKSREEERKRKREVSDSYGVKREYITQLSRCLPKRGITEILSGLVSGGGIGSRTSILDDG